MSEYGVEMFSKVSVSIWEACVKERLRVPKVKKKLGIWNGIYKSHSLLCQFGNIHNFNRTFSRATARPRQELLEQILPCASFIPTTGR